LCKQDLKSKQKERNKKQRSLYFDKKSLKFSKKSNKNLGKEKIRGF
jgi:hypothetical protein